MHATPSTDSPRCSDVGAARRCWSRRSSAACGHPARRCSRCAGWQRRPRGSPNWRWTAERSRSPNVSPGATPTQRTEVGQVGAALNHMLDHVGAALAARQASEMRVRQFVADASHELRTPLAAIRGYAELTRREPGPGAARRHPRADPDRVRGAPDDRPGARICCCSPDSTPAGPTSMCRSTCRGWWWRPSTTHAQRGMPTSGAWNCRTSRSWSAGVKRRCARSSTTCSTTRGCHTPPGTTVRPASATSLARPLRRSGRRPSRCTSPMTDPGIRPELIPDLFERFTRGDTSRSRASGSTGLGLAIVAAIVQAHGGLVFVRSADGSTSFTVRLPAWRRRPVQ